MFRTKTQFLAAIIISLSAISVALADAPVNIAVRALSQKLKSDLAVSAVNLKVSKIQRQNISKSEVRIKGSGAANDLPLNFDVKVNIVKQAPTDISYAFADASAPATITEDLLTRDLLNQLNKDYKTENIVVSIDGFDTTQVNGKKNYKGTGDVRIGFDWSKLSFDVTLDEKTGAAAGVKYEVQK